jgi:hypothetical protein
MHRANTYVSHQQTHNRPHKQARDRQYKRTSAGENKPTHQIIHTNTQTSSERSNRPINLPTSQLSKKQQTNIRRTSTNTYKNIQVTNNAREATTITDARNQTKKRHPPTQTHEGHITTNTWKLAAHREIHKYLSNNVHDQHTWTSVKTTRASKHAQRKTNTHTRSRNIETSNTQTTHQPNKRVRVRVRVRARIKMRASRSWVCTRACACARGGCVYECVCQRVDVRAFVGRV